MSESKVKQARASSARQADMRPSSSKNRKLHQKTQFIDNVYGANHTASHASNYHSFQKNKLFSNRLVPADITAEDVSKLMPKSDQMIKEKEQMFEQNLHLKKQLNKMKDELMKSKTKIEMLSSKNSKYTKQFNRQFEKKMYWTGNNSYLISGIKAQYEKLKEQLTDKQAQCQALKRQLIESRAPQFKVYAETLQQENKKLAERITKMAEVSEHVLFQNSGDKSIPQYVYLELQGKLDKVDEKLKETQFQLKAQKQQNKDLQKKIQFLEKLLIEKDNSQYHASKKAKKLDKEKILLEQKIKNITILKEDSSKNYEAKLEKLKSMEDKRFKAEKDIFDRTIHERDIRIQKLEKEVAYLSTLLTYWKPLDQLKENQQRNFHDDDQSSQFNNKEAPKNKKLQESFNQDRKGSEVPEKSRRMTLHEQKGDFILKSSSQLPNNIREITKNQATIQNRVQQTADKKHNENAEKKRKLDYKQVEHLGQHLKYRFLGLRLNINQVKKYFDFNKNSANPETNFILGESGKVQPSTQSAWQIQYINMKEAKETLKHYPFELPEPDAHILARYLIQDSLNDFVYVDEKNEHKRSIVKSIIKALVGNYEILEGERQLHVEKQCRDMLDKYQGNLLSALSTMASSGYTSRKKFIQLLSSLGIELSQQGKDFLVCKMLLKSQSLNKLSYMIILD